MHAILRARSRQITPPELCVARHGAGQAFANKLVEIIGRNLARTGAARPDIGLLDHMAFWQVCIGHDRAAGKPIHILFGGGALLGIVRGDPDFAGTVDQMAQFGRIHRIDDIRPLAIARIGIVPLKD